MAVAEQSVQIVETLVIVTVEMVLEVVTKVELPEVTVLVTGQVVTVSQVTTVVVASPGARGVPAGDETAEVTLGAEGVPAEVPLAGGDPAEELTGETPVGTADRGVEPTSAVVVSVTGRTVVETGIVEVTTVVECAGQLVTVGAQLVIVTKLVVYMVDVVIWTGVVITGVEVAEVTSGVSPAVEEIAEEGKIEDPGTDVPLATPGIPADELTGETPLGLDTAGTESELVAVAVVSVTGQTVVERAIVEVTTTVDPAGQLVTVGAQLVIVIKLVVNTVEVVI